MAAPRATQFLALRNLSRGSQQVRQLHMTGPATYASPVLTRERSVLNLPHDIAGLRAECKRRNIDTAGSKSDLIKRLNADELFHSRAFSTHRPTVSPNEDVVSKPAARHFNTSRELKAVNDSSTIDFTFFNEIHTAEEVDTSSHIRVPILPTMELASTRSNIPVEVEETVVMKPQISSTSADTVVLPMAELTDGHAMGIDFHDMADRVAANLRRMAIPAEEQAGMMKQVFADLVDDVMNVSKNVARA